MQTKTLFKNLAFVAAFSGLLLAGCGKQQGKSGKAGTKEHSAAVSGADSSAAAENLPFTTKEGKRLYTHYCAVCHGDAGDGSGQYYGFSLTPSPANFTDKAFMKTLSDESIYKVISDGSASVGKSNMCPPWGKSFNREEIEVLVSYVRTFSGG
jgi:mono/diheme cytochrome c family protein